MLLSNLTKKSVLQMKKRQHLQQAGRCRIHICRVVGVVAVVCNVPLWKGVVLMWCVYFVAESGVCLEKGQGSCSSDEWNRALVVLSLLHRDEGM